jgi:putative DNA primase/helicase
MSDPLDRVLSRLASARRSGNGWTAKCPAHDDRQASLSVGTGRDGRVLVKCFAGCTPQAVLAAAGLDYPADLFEDDSGAHSPQSGRSNGSGPPRKIVATYDYPLPAGAVLQNVRYQPKDFRVRQSNGRGGWTWNMTGIERVPLYRESMINAARAEQMEVVVVEGEEDVHACEEAGLIAVTNIGGAKGWKADYGERLAGVSRVIVWADKDEPGLAWAADVAASVRPHVERVDVVQSDRGKDARDHFAAGGEFEDLVPAAQPVSRGPAAGVVDEVTDPWVGYCLADIDPLRSKWLWEGYLPAGHLVTFDGDPATGKSILATAEIPARITTGAPMPHEPSDERHEPAAVILLSAEDDLASTVVPRLLAAGADRSKVYALNRVRRRDSEGRPYLDDFQLPGDVPTLGAYILRVKARLVVFDVLSAYLNVNTWKDGDVRRALSPLADLAHDTGCTIMGVRHLSKGSSGGPAVYRGGGSIAIGGASRVVLMAAHDPTDDEGERRVLAVVKNNLGRQATSLCYEVINDPMWHAGRIRWGGISNLRADDLAFRPRGAGGRPGQALDDAKDWLEGALLAGPMKYADVKRGAAREGISATTLDRAAQALDVTRKRAGQGKDHGSMWMLPGTDIGGGLSGEVDGGPDDGPGVEPFF